MVAVRLGVDQITDRRFVLHALAPAHRVDRLLRRIDHDIAIARLDKARIAAGEVNFGERILSYPAHGPLLPWFTDPARVIPRRPAPARDGTRGGPRQRITGLIAA